MIPLHPVDSSGIKPLSQVHTPPRVQQAPIRFAGDEEKDKTDTKKTWIQYFQAPSMGMLSAVFSFLSPEKRFAMESKMLFHPTLPASVDQVNSTFLKGKVEEVRIPVQDGDKALQLNAWYVAPQSGKPTVLFSTGNAASILGIGRYELMMKEGYGFLAYEYPGYGKSEGTPSEQSLYKAVDAVSEYLKREKGADYTNQVLMGLSLGGAVTVEQATKHPYKAVILENTFTSLADVVNNMRAAVPKWWFPIEDKIQQRFDSIAKADKITSPLMVIHGEKDTLVPVHLGESLFAAAKNSPVKTSLWVPHADHNTLSPETVKEMVAFLNKLG